MKLWHYILENRKGKDAHRIEKEAMKDPFLADALEGYEQTQGNHQKRVTKLQREINRREKQLTSEVAGREHLSLKAWSITAGILLVAGVATWFFLQEGADIPIAVRKERVIAKNTVIHSDTVIETHKADTTDPLQSQPVAGMEAYREYIKRNLTHPDDECRNIKGAVIVVFKVGQSGRPHQIRVTQGLCSSINKEAIRLIINGPDWRKGTDTDEATITIDF